MTEKNTAERRGFLRALGLAAVAAPAAASAAETPHRADSVPAASAQKEAQGDRLKARYQGESAHVQAFYATNRY